MISYIKIDVKLRDHKIVPLPFIGSTLRGSFGASLKKVVCTNTSYECDGCLINESCLYYDFFEKKNSPHLYRFSFVLNPKRYDFSLYLFEDATKKLPYIITAIYKMLVEQGLTVKRERFEIETITCNGQTIYEDGTFDISSIKAKQFENSATASNIKLYLNTPLRIKYKNKILRQKPPLELLLYSILNRVNSLKNRPKEKLPFAPSYSESGYDIYFKDINRFSNRQQSRLKIGGLLGFISYDDIDQKSYQLLKLGEVIGVGKQTVFGLGDIKIVLN